MPENNEQAQGDKAWMYQQRDVAYVTVSPSLSDACAGCRWFNSYGSGYYVEGGQHPDCRIVDSYPNPIEATGWCSKFEAMPAEPPVTPMPVVIVDADVTAVTVDAAELGDKAEDDAPPDEDMPDDAETPDPEADEDTAEVATVNVPSGIRKLMLNLQAEIAKAFGRKSEDFTGFKVVDDHWLAVWSNNFKDRDGELFTAKAIDDYVERADMGVVPLPELWVWHIGKSVRIGAVDWVGRHGHFLFAAGTFDADDKAQTAKAYYAKHAAKTTISHGFTYPPDKFDGKHYHQFNTFEISLLPTGAEANLYTSLAGVKAMELSDTKKQYMAEVFGKERAEQILADWEKRGKALEELGVAFKDFVGTDATADALTEARKEAQAKAEKAFGELLSDALEGGAEAIVAATEAVTAAKALKDENAALRTDIAALKAVVQSIQDDAPRASQSKQTEVEASHLSADLQEQLKQQQTERHPFWGTEVVKTP
jgi:hypothetical protein